MTTVMVDQYDLYRHQLSSTSEWIRRPSAWREGRRPGAVMSCYRFLYLLAFLPTITEYLEQGRFPTPGRELITDVLLTVAIVSLVWRLRREYREVLYLSRTDHLTGLGNRRKLREDLTAEVGHARRRAEPLTLAFFDLDRFKSINDRFGHEEGDEVLARIGRLLQQAILARGAGWYRFGGDEFVGILPSMDADRARHALSLVGDAIAELLAPYGAGLSIGLTQLGGNDSVQDLLHRADLHLYAEKSGSARQESRIAPSDG